MKCIFKAPVFQKYIHMVEEMKRNHACNRGNVQETKKTQNNNTSIRELTSFQILRVNFVTTFEIWQESYWNWESHSSHIYYGLLSAFDLTDSCIECKKWNGKHFFICIWKFVTIWIEPFCRSVCLSFSFLFTQRLVNEWPKIVYLNCSVSNEDIFCSAL